MATSKEQFVASRVINDERFVQHLKWGGPAHDDEHNMLEFVSFMQERLEQIDIDTEPNRKENRRLLIQVAALAKAALESDFRKYGFPCFTYGCSGVWQHEGKCETQSDRCQTMFKSIVSEYPRQCCHKKNHEPVACYPM